MLDKRFTLGIALMLTMIMGAGQALAEGAKTFAVTPFTYNGPQKYAYFPKAFQASLNNDLEWTGHVEPADDSVVESLKAPRDKAQAITALRDASVDYIITGNITILGKEANLSMKAFGASGTSWSNKGQMAIDEITPWLDEQSKAIMGDVFNRPGYGNAAKESKKPEAPTMVAAPTNSAIIQADGQGTPATLNPQFRYEGGTDSVGRWRSQTLRFFSTSMVVGDADNDGQNEVFILHSKGISAYRYFEGKLKHIDTMELTKNTKFLRLELVDTNRDDQLELVVSTYQTESHKLERAPEGWPKSHILSFEGGRFKYLLKSYNRFLGVMRVPPMYRPILVAQKKGQRGIFDKRIHEAVFKDGEIKLGQTIPLPEYGNILNTVYLPDGLGYKYVVIDDFHRLKVYDQTMERLSSSDEETYNSSGVAIEYSSRPAGMGSGIVDEDSSTYNIPFRMIPTSLSTKGKYELLVNKDLSVAARVFERFTYYSQGEIHSLGWDGVGMNLVWKTRRIKGQVSDIALADLNNDGKKQLVVLVNTFPGGMGFTKRKTVVIAYDLNQ